MKKGKRIITIICAVICMSVFMTGCTGDQKTIDEPEITVYYLTGEYAAQLKYDGASVLFGTIDLIAQEDGTIWVDIREKEYVEDANHPNGFYIADRNLESTYYLSSEARATFLSGRESVAQAMDYDEFAYAVWQDFFEFGIDNPEYQEYKLYDIYIMSDEIQLLIARYIS